MLAEANDPVEPMASIGAMIATKLYTEAMAAGDPIEPNAFLAGGVEIMREIGEFAVANGIELGQSDIEEAFLLASEMVREALVSMGLIDEEEMRQAAIAARKVIPPEELQQGMAMMDRAKQRVGEALMPQQQQQNVGFGQ